MKRRAVACVSHDYFIAHYEWVRRLRSRSLRTPKPQATEGILVAVRTAPAPPRALDPDQRAFKTGRFGSGKDSRSDVLLVCSPGGHLQQMLALRPAWDDFRHAWVALRAPDAEFLLADEVVVWGHGPTNRSVSKFLLNLPLAWRTLRRLDPAVVISTGAGLAVPFLLLARLQGRRTVYVESLTRVEGLSLSGRLLYPLAHRFFVQWPEAARHHRKAIYPGSVL